MGQRWTQALKEHPDAIAFRPPNAHLLADITDLPPGNALDAGCGHGAETIWLATSGWRVDAVDFSTTALEQARSTAQAIGADVADRIDWIEGDLTTWAPAPARFDLIISLYVHISGSVSETIERLGSGVAPGGTLFLVGHQPLDPETGAPTSAAGQPQVSVDDARRAFDPARWEIVIAEERRRPAENSGVDTVVRATLLR